ncbi:arginine N-methyltransferase 2 [Chlorella sorokiniana]|uniref:Arginine N-methyltransferase 2 n=1 Tax=Chlorella sorokiniana TaxID=3076 RepID=A0A2P6TND8_CHLSO|nr:arginine N-methyltransferase 2 [Chlorella sorokiniana]|eukprot:PRW50850.1 arginine N-methyltransferase 2 [Chlorella sorokiniana]
MAQGQPEERQDAADIAQHPQDGAEEAPSAEERLMAAAAAGDGPLVAQLLRDGAEPACETEEGITPLMLAAESGSAEAVQALLEAGATWHAQDRDGHTAGEYASGAKQRHILQQLLDWAVRAELLLGTISRREREGEPPVNRDYLSSSIRYEEGEAGGKLMDEQGEAVMMGWETPLMERHAAIICASGGDVLNVGFGMGIIDGFIQTHKPRSHTIIEAHPDVYKYACSQGWDKKPGVRLLHGRWQDVVDELGPFDGIFFDTYGEYYEDMHDFHEKLPKLLRPGGVYSFFNGLAPDNMFFHLVYGEIARLELGRLGLETSYAPMPMDASAAKIWEGVANRYWRLPVYFVPTCLMKGLAGEAAAATTDAGQLPAAAPAAGAAAAAAAAAACTR